MYVFLIHKVRLLFLWVMFIILIFLCVSSYINTNYIKTIYFYIFFLKKLQRLNYHKYKIIANTVLFLLFLFHLFFHLLLQCHVYMYFSFYLYLIFMFHFLLILYLYYTKNQRLLYDIPNTICDFIIVCFCNN